MERGDVVAPIWTPDFSLHPTDFDLRELFNLRIADLKSRLVSPRSTEPQSHIRRRSIQAVPAVAHSEMRRSFEHAVHSRPGIP
jgi:hypothetical protein